MFWIEITLSLKFGSKTTKRLFFYRIEAAKEQNGSEQMPLIINVL